MLRKSYNIAEKKQEHTKWLGADPIPRIELGA
jgi:hypothetical protein